MNRFYVIVVEKDGEPRTLRNDYEGCLYIYSDLDRAEHKVKEIRKELKPRIVVLHDIKMDMEATRLYEMKK